MTPGLSTDMTEIPNAETALIFMTARDCEMYVAQSLMSLARQTYDNLHVLFIDDQSQDGTAAIAKGMLADLFPKRHTFVGNDERKGKARNAWDYLRPLAERAGFVAVLDGDDQLIDPNILARMAESYRKGRDIVWTNYATDTGLVGGNRALDPEIPPRRQGWRTSHFFSFRASLMANVPESYFKDSAGRWLQAACDIALAMPMLDQTRRYEFIPEAAYRYTASNPYSHHNLDPQSQGLNSTIQRQSAQEVFSKLPLPLIRPLEGKGVQSAPPSAMQGVAVPNSTAATRVQPEPKAEASERPLPTSAASPWQDAAARLLAEAVPGLIDAQALAGSDPLSPMQVWALRKAAVNLSGAPIILHAGSPRSALVLGAIASELGGMVTCLCRSEGEAEGLQARLAASGLTSSAVVIQAKISAVTFDEITAEFFDLSPLDENIRFDMVLLDWPRGSPTGLSAQVALPALASRLAPQRFSFHLMAESRDAEVQAATRWSRMSNGLKFCIDALGGSGLSVFGG
jgi:hypothetical protein